MVDWRRRLELLSRRCEGIRARIGLIQDEPRSTVAEELESLQKELGLVIDDLDGVIYETDRNETKNERK